MTFAHILKSFLFGNQGPIWHGKNQNHIVTLSGVHMNLTFSLERKNQWKNVNLLTFPVFSSSNDWGCFHIQNPIIILLLVNQNWWGTPPTRKKNKQILIIMKDKSNPNKTNENQQKENYVMTKNNSKGSIKMSEKRSKRNTIEIDTRSYQNFCAC